MNYEKNKKISYRLFSILLCISMLGSSLCGCDSDKGKKQESSTVSASQKSTKSTTTTAGTTAASTAAGTTSSGTKATSKSTTKSAYSKTTKATAPRTTRAPAVYASPQILTPVASGTVVYSDELGLSVIDASNTRDGYIMVKYSGSNPKVKIMVKGSREQYYDINKRGEYEVFPLTEGSRTYTLGIYENISGEDYSTLQSQSISVSLSSSFAPYLRPNQLVNYSGGTSAISKAADLSTGCGSNLEKVQNIYNFVVNNFTYDYNEADTVQPGYIPDLNSVYAKRSGICYDYAAIMTAMLRSQGIPTKMVFGEAKSAGYHAWINVYLSESGWVNGVIYFDGQNWKLMDPTFASTGKQSASIYKYINDTSNYSPTFYY